MTEMTKTIEERVAALETKTTTLSTDVSNATTVANRAAGSATAATSTANTAKANAGTAQATASTAAAAAAAARKIAEDAALTAEDAFGETADNLKAIEDDVRPALKNLQNKDAALQTAIDAIPDVSANITALEMMLAKLKENVDAIPDVSDEITALEAKDVELQAAIDDIPTAPAEILPIPVDGSVEVSGVGENFYITLRNIVPGRYGIKMVVDTFDKSELGIPERLDVSPYFGVEDRVHTTRREALYFRGIPGDGSELNELNGVIDVRDGNIENWPDKEANEPDRRVAGYLDIRPFFVFEPTSAETGPHSGQDQIGFTLTLSRIS